MHRAPQRPSRQAPLAFLAAWASLCAACDPPVYPGPAQLVLGGGVYGFVHEPACARVAIFHGPQGGYHLWTSLRARYIDFSSVLVDVRYRDPRSGALLHQVPPGEVDFDEVTPARLSLLDVGDAAPAPSGCPDGGLVPEAPPPSAVPGGTDGWGEVLALTGYLPPAFTGCQVAACYAEQAVLQEVTITDDDGRSASDARTLWPYLLPDDVSPYCTGDPDFGIVAVDLGGFSCQSR